MPLRFLVVASETPDQRADRRQAAGAASDETYAQTLADIEPGCVCDLVSCVDGTPVPPAETLRGYDAVVFAGSPIAMTEDNAATRSATEFMRAVFRSNVPAFGSCAGLQIATVAAGGRARTREPRLEAGFARGIVATEAGRSHPLLAGRPIAWDAPAMHSQEIAELPPGSLVLASTRTTPVQAAEIRFEGGVFWGVQYHPELTLGEIATALLRERDDLLEEGLAQDEGDLERFAARLAALGDAPDRRDLAWQLGLDEEITQPRRRMTEIHNFIDHLVRPRRRETPRAAA